MSTPLYCQYFTTEITASDLPLITATLRAGHQVADTMLSMATAALYNYTLTFTGESGRFTDHDDRVLTAFSSLAGPDPRKVDTSGASYAAVVSIAEDLVSKTSGATRLHQECRRRVL
ncbi:hypothetical protein ACUY20_09565 [Corynebacterium segmentosum]